MGISKRAAEAEPSTEHLLPLHDGWSVWSWFRLKSAGFPASFVAPLASPRAASEVDAFEESPEDGASGVGARLRETLATARVSEARALQAICRDRAFREAVVWQNRALVGRVLEPLLRTDAHATDAKTRERQSLVVRYAQRYGLKNDTIGFFGPIGWGTFTTDDPAIACAPGPSLVRDRVVSFEQWPIAILAKRLGDDPTVKPHLCPRRLPSVRVDGDRAYFPVDRSAVLPALVRRLLAACDGRTTALAIAATMLDEPAFELEDVAEVYALIEELCEKGLLSWTIALPGALAPERELRAVVAALPESHARTEVANALDDLDAGRRAAAAAVGDPEGLARALASLDATFEAVAGVAASRRSGEIYAGRALVYEDALRDVEVRIGARERARLGRPLALVLTSARWYSHAIAARYHAAFVAIHDQLAVETGSPAIDYLRFMRAIEPSFSARQGIASPIVADVLAELHRKWATVLGSDAASPSGTIRRSSPALAPLVAAAFAAPGPGWPIARYHSPDVLFVSSQCGAYRDGEYAFVLGEVHPTTNTLVAPFALAHHPDAQAVLLARERDVPFPCVVPVEAAAHVTRADQLLGARHDVAIEIGATPSSSPERAVCVADLVVTNEAGRIIVATRDGRHRFDSIAFFERYLTFGSIAHFGLVGAAAVNPGRPSRTPRVVIDELVVARATFTFHPESLGFARVRDPANRFVALRRWVAREGLPRHVFVKTPEEPKPIYVDLESLLFVEVFVRLVRGASVVRISEMLPRADDAWLEDCTGERFTSELRVAAVDPLAWSVDGSTSDS